MLSCQTEGKRVACAIIVLSYESNGRVTGGIMSIYAVVYECTQTEKIYSTAQ